MVREVSEDHIFNSIEFNEFLQMMSKQRTQPITTDHLIEAFRLQGKLILLSSFFFKIFFRMFDRKESGIISVKELVRILTKLGNAMKKYGSS